MQTPTNSSQSNQTANKPQNPKIPNIIFNLTTEMKIKTYLIQFQTNSNAKVKSTNKIQITSLKYQKPRY